MTNTPNHWPTWRRWERGGAADLLNDLDLRELFSHIFDEAEWPRGETQGTAFRAGIIAERLRAENKRKAREDEIARPATDAFVDEDFFFGPALRHAAREAERDAPRERSAWPNVTEIRKRMQANAGGMPDPQVLALALIEVADSVSGHGYELMNHELNGQDLARRVEALEDMSAPIKGRSDPVTAPDEPIEPDVEPVNPNVLTVEIDLSDVPELFLPNREKRKDWPEYEMGKWRSLIINKGTIQCAMWNSRTITVDNAASALFPLGGCTAILFYDQTEKGDGKPPVAKVTRRGLGLEEIGGPAPEDPQKKITTTP